MDDIIQQLADTSDLPEGFDPQSALDAVSAASPDTDEWGETEWEAVSDAFQSAIDAYLAEADEIRRSCQMTGQAAVGDIIVRPNAEFIEGSGPASARAKRLRDWPTSSSWFVTVTAPDGESDLVEQGDARSWAAVLGLARQAQHDWEERVRAQRHARQDRILRALGARRAAWTAVTAAGEDLAQAKAADDEPEIITTLRGISDSLDDLALHQEDLMRRRDQAIRTAAAGGTSPTVITQATGITRARYYQILDAADTRATDDQGIH